MRVVAGLVWLVVGLGSVFALATLSPRPRVATAPDPSPVELDTGYGDDQLDLVSEKGLTPLMMAAAANDVDAATALLDAGADPNATGREGLGALHVASIAGTIPIIELLVERGASIGLRSDNGMNALHHAAASDRPEAVRSLVGIGMDPDERSSAVLQGHGHPRVVGPPALALAARSGHLPAVDALLDAGAAVDRTSEGGHTPLLVAVFSDSDVEVVRRLVEEGASLGVAAACDQGCSSGNGRQLTVAQWAAALGREAMLPILQPPPE